MKQNSLRSQLLNLEKTQLVDLLYQSQFDTYFATACDMFDEHNTYGGGSGRISPCQRK